MFFLFLKDILVQDSFPLHLSLSEQVSVWAF